MGMVYVRTVAEQAQYSVRVAHQNYYKGSGSPRSSRGIAISAKSHLADVGRAVTPTKNRLLLEGIYYTGTVDMQERRTVVFEDTTNR